MARRTRNADLGRRFGENLVRCRRRADFSQEELARGAALHRTEIGMLEHGRRVPSIETLIKVARTLNIWEASLLDGIDWVPGVNGRRGEFVFHPPLDPSMLRWIGEGDG